MSAEVSSRAKDILEKIKYGIYPDTPKKVVDLIRSYQTADPATRLNIIGELMEQGTHGCRAVMKLVQLEDKAETRQFLITEVSARVNRAVPGLLADGNYDTLEMFLDIGLAGEVKSGAPNFIAYYLLRNKLDAHKHDETCAACHRKIDPLGLAFDNYDAIGRWRTVETVHAGVGEDPKLDPSGELYDGRTFQDAKELKKILVDDTDKFATAFTEKLATYALRRGTTFADRVELKHVTEQAKASDYKLASLIESFVTSEIFLKR